MDNKKLIVRKAKDGINHEAVIMHYCGEWYESQIASGHTKSDAIRSLISSLKAEIFILEGDLELACYGKFEDL